LNLAAKIEQRNAFAIMIGLSYVGLPWAAVFSLAGFAVLGLDIVAYANAVLFAVSKNYFRQLADRFVAGSSGDWKFEEPR
jgi:UDP-N-acetyl-D-mannosaminuronate dehydrogenase